MITTGAGVGTTTTSLIGSGITSITGTISAAAATVAAWF
jgi:hypothetical protein